MAEIGNNAGATDKTAAARRKQLGAKGVANLADALASSALRALPAIASAVHEAEEQLAQMKVPERPETDVFEPLPRAQAAYRKMVPALPTAIANEPDMARAVLMRVFRQIKLRGTTDGGLVAVLETTPEALIALVSGR